MTLAHLLAWKAVRAPQLSNDGRWFAYELSSNEGDAEVVIRSTAADAREWRYALRMTEWFDTLLRDQPAPDWMKAGIPRLQMESHLKSRRPMTDAKAEVPRVQP